MFICDIKLPNGKVNRFHLGKGIFQIGKGSSCRIVLEDQLVSRVHAEVRVDETSATIMDLNSTNGTWIGEQQIVRPYRLDVGDHIRIGTASYLVVREIPNKLDSMFFSINGSGAGSEYFAEETLFDKVQPDNPARRENLDLSQPNFDPPTDPSYSETHRPQSPDPYQSHGPRRRPEPRPEMPDHSDHRGRASGRDMGLEFDMDEYGSRMDEDVDYGRRSRSGHEAPSGPSNPYQDSGDSPFQSDAPFAGSSIYEDDFSPFASPPPSTSPAPAPYSDNSSPYSDTSSPYADTSSPYADNSSPYADTSSPYADNSSPYADNASPYSSPQPDPYSAPASAPAPAYEPPASASASSAPKPTVAPVSQEILTTLVNLLDQPRVQWVLVSGNEGVRLAERGGGIHPVRVFNQKVSAEAVLSGFGLGASVRNAMEKEVSPGVMLSAIPMGNDDWSLVLKRESGRARLSSLDTMVSKNMMSIDISDFISHSLRAKANIIVSCSVSSIGLEFVEAAKKQVVDGGVVAAFEDESKTQGVQVGGSGGYVFTQNLIELGGQASTVLRHLSSLGVNFLGIDDLCGSDLVSVLNFSSGTKAGFVGSIEAATPMLGLANLARSQKMDGVALISMMLTSSCDLWIHIDGSVDGSGHVAGVYDLIAGADRVLKFLPIFRATRKAGDIEWTSTGHKPLVLRKMELAGVRWKPEWFQAEEASGAEANAAEKNGE